MLYLLPVLALATLVYLSLRTMGTRPRTRVIGPDDDPDFMRRISRDDNPS